MASEEGQLASLSNYLDLQGILLVYATNKNDYINTRKCWEHVEFLERCNDTILKKPQCARGHWRQPSLTTCLRWAYAELTAISDFRFGICEFLFDVQTKMLEIKCVPTSLLLQQKRNLQSVCSWAVSMTPCFWSNPFTCTWKGYLSERMKL